MLVFWQSRHEFSRRARQALPLGIGIEIFFIDPQRFVFRAPRGRLISVDPNRAWFAEAKQAQWTTPQAIKALHRTASFVGKDRIVFNIGGNKYRLVVAGSYSRGSMFIRFVGTHRQYDQIDVEAV